jgi:hypothetical protein
LTDILDDLRASNEKNPLSPITGERTRVRGRLGVILLCALRTILEFPSTG